MAVENSDRIHATAFFELRAADNEIDFIEAAEVVIAQSYRESAAGSARVRLTSAVPDPELCITVQAYGNLAETGNLPLKACCWHEPGDAEAEYRVRVTTDANALSDGFVHIVWHQINQAGAGIGGQPPPP